MDGRINRTKFMLVDKGNTNLWLAMQLGKDPATVSKWCANLAQPSLETIMQIAKLLNVDITTSFALKPCLICHLGRRQKKTFRKKKN